jgi:DegV family protein with EDD domain
MTIINKSFSSFVYAPFAGIIVIPLTNLSWIAACSSSPFLVTIIAVSFACRVCITSITLEVTYNVTRVYNAFSHPNTKPAVIIIKPFRAKKYIPTARSFIREITRTTISIPPVDAPHLNVNPIPIAAITPPNTAFSKMSSEIFVIGINSRKKVVATTLIMLKIVNDFPNFNHPRIATGIFNTKRRIPVDSGNTDSLSILESSCAIPVKPLENTFAGIKKKLRATAPNRAPNRTIIVFFISVIFITTFLSNNFCIDFICYKGYTCVQRLEKEVCLMSVQIIADSSCDLPKHIIDEYNILIMPLVVSIGDGEFYDKETIQPNELYQQMRQGETPRTSQVPLNIMRDTFMKMAEENKSCIYLSLSAGLSGTYQSAQSVLEQLREEGINLDLTIIESQSASLGLGLTVFHAAKLAAAEKNKEEILKSIDEALQYIKHVFTVDDLEYLLRGGRVSRTQAFVGSLLKIKPILHMEEGKLFPLEKVRGSKKVLSRLLELMDEQGSDLENQTIAISHADDIERANQLKELIEQQYGIKQIMINSIGCAIGSHVGPGTLALFFYEKKLSE